MDVHLINDEVRGLPRCVWLQDAHLGDLLNAVSLLLQEVCLDCQVSLLYATVSTYIPFVSAFVKLYGICFLIIVELSSHYM